MKRRASVGVSLLAIGLGLVVRSWLLTGVEESFRDEVVVPILPTEFNSVLTRIELLRPLHRTKQPNQPGDWLEKFHEDGQAFPYYVQYRSRKPLCDEYSEIEVQPLGEFDETQERIIEQTAEFLGHFFGVPIRILDHRPLDDIPTSARRMRDDVEQVLTTWILNEQIRPNRQPDAMATIAVVTCDLWPGDLNWVFGQASIVDRIGVWSLHRNGDPHTSEAAYQLCLRRTIKTAAHETGHMLGIPHCIAYECCMNGYRSGEESDRQPLEFCPECQAKIWWSCGADPLRRCRALFEFCDRKGLKREAELFRKEVKLLESENQDVVPVSLEKNGKKLEKESI